MVAPSPFSLGRVGASRVNKREVHKILRMSPGYDPFKTAAKDDWFDYDEAFRASEFIETFCRHTKGDLAGQTIHLEDWELAIVWNAFGWKQKDGKRRFREVFLFVPRKNGKALALDTKIPTPNGWTTMGEIKVGDFVFSSDGTPAKVIEATDTMYGRPCFELVFSDGERVVCDADHQWVTDSRQDRDRLKGRGGKTKGPKPSVKTAAEISKTVHCRSENNHRIELAAPVQYPEKNLEIHPYLLGAWLGDGSSGGGQITVCESDSDHLKERFSRHGYALKPLSAPILYRIGPSFREKGVRKIDTFQGKLRALGVLKNKHIPRIYLEASVDQRMELLKGLMDTDGFASKAGQCEFCTTSPKIMQGVSELLSSLGLKHSVNKKTATLNGKVVGDKYRVMFWAYRESSVFSLPRKTERLKPTPKTSTRNKYRQIVECNPVPSVPVRCIQVEREDGLFLCGERFVTTHNSLLIAAVGNYLFFADNEKGKEIYCAAAEKDQAALVWNMAKQQVLFEPAMESRCRIFNASKSIVNEKDGSFFRPISADADTKHGFNAHGILFDELHAQKDSELVDVLNTSTGARSQPITIYMTTSDFQREGSICNEKHDYASKVRDGIIEDRRFYPIIYEATTEDDWKDPKTWEKANPNLGVSVSRDYLERECRHAQENPRYQNTFKRLHLNIKTEQDVRWLLMEKWDACVGEITLEDLDGEECFGGLDLASTSDLCAFELYFPKYCAALSWFWVPKASAIRRLEKNRVPYMAWSQEGFINMTDGDVADYDRIRADINKIGQKYNIREIGIDRWNSTQLQVQLMDDGFEVVPFGQGFASMSAPTKELERLVLQGRLVHFGNKVLRWCASNVMVETDSADNIKPSKKKSTEKIDGIVALIMAIGRAVVQSEMDGKSVYEERGIVML